jgi:hypothetical protein
MATGRKTGGRVAGTPNRKTGDVEELLASLDCDPIRGMAEIARNPEASLELRGRMYSELSQYVYAKRKAVEHSGADGAPIREKLEVVFVGSRDGRPANEVTENQANGKA